MTQHIADLRVLPKCYDLPNYAAVWRRWGDQAEVARPLIFLGVKLTEADDYRRRLAAVDVTRLDIPAQRAFSRDLDAFVFVTYGGLDALSQVIAAVAKAHTPREIKFPLLASILAEDVRQPARWTQVAGWLETRYRAPWYVEVRRLRKTRGNVMGEIFWHHADHFRQGFPPAEGRRTQQYADDKRVYERG